MGSEPSWQMRHALSIDNISFVSCVSGNEEGGSRKDEHSQHHHNGNNNNGPSHCDFNAHHIGSSSGSSQRSSQDMSKNGSMEHLDRISYQQHQQQQHHHQNSQYQSQQQQQQQRQNLQNECHGRSNGHSTNSNTNNSSTRSQRHDNGPSNVGQHPEADEQENIIPWRAQLRKTNSRLSLVG